MRVTITIDCAIVASFKSVNGVQYKHGICEKLICQYLNPYMEFSTPQVCVLRFRNKLLGGNYFSCILFFKIVLDSKISNKNWSNFRCPKSPKRMLNLGFFNHAFLYLEKNVEYMSATPVTNFNKQRNLQPLYPISSESYPLKAIR